MCIKWFANIMNTPDNTHSPVINPKVELSSQLNFVDFYPKDSLIFPSLVFTANPPLYTWNFQDFEIYEPEHLPLNAWMSENTVISKPRFTASSSVVPETLTD